jgi:hypothetical protein
MSPLREVSRFRVQADDYLSLLFAADGKTLAGCQGHRIECWEVASGKRTWDWGLAGERRWGEWGRVLPGLGAVVSWKVRGVAFGNAVAPEPEPEVRVRDVRTGKELLSFRHPGGEAVVGAVSPDGRLLALGVLGGPTLVYRLDTGQEIGCLGGKVQFPAFLAFSPDGRTLAATDLGGMVRLWELASGEERQSFRPYPRHWMGGFNWPRPGGQFPCLFSADGLTLATWDYGAPVRLWDAATGRSRGRLKGHLPAFSPDGRLLATVEANSTVLLWDLAQLLHEPPAAPLAAETLEKLWDGLAGGDARQAFQASAALRRAGDQAVSFLRTRLTPAAPLPPARLARLLADLDDDEFRVRERATRELETLLDAAAPALRQGLAHDPPPEVRRRLVELLDRADRGLVSGEAVRAVRAVELLEGVASADARRLLRSLADGAPARLTTEARASLRRLQARPGP